MAGRSKYAVFGLGMLALVVGVSLSLWMLLARPGPAPEDTPSLSQALEQTLGLTEEEAGELAQRLQAAAEQAQAAAPTGGETSLAQALQQALGLSEEEAVELAARLQAAVAQAAAATGGGGTGGTQEQVGMGDSVQFEVRDAEGNIKQKGSGQ